MKTACPQCGAEIEFRFDDSFVRVCGSCRAAVARTDRGIQTLGQFADLVPVQSPLSLFAEGTYGGMGFILVGKAQIRHAAGGMWQEWYAKFGSGVWGWLAEAQGRYYMTFEVPNLPVTPHYQLQPGAQRSLPTRAGERTFTVSEVGVATFVAADGELPYRLVPGSMFRYADLADGQGGFATIDYGPPEARDPRVGPTEPPSIYIGGQIRFEDLHLSGGSSAPPGAGPRITSQRLACPTCNGSLELRAPDSSLRVVCPYCNSLLDVDNGNLKYLKSLGQRPTLAIPLGAMGRFSDGSSSTPVELQVIGYLERSARVDGEWYPFHEYLLHSPSLGFRWLVCSDGHWSYVQPVANGACPVTSEGAHYGGALFKHYQTGTLRVDRVYGELYWRASAGNTSHGDDFIAPPFMLSREQEGGEINWSLSTYLTPAEVRAAFGEAGKQLALPRPEGVAPNQVWPHRGFGAFYALLVIALLALGLVMAMSTHERSVTSFTVEVPPGRGQPLPAVPGEAPGSAPAGFTGEAPAAAETGHVFFSEPFAIREGENVEVRLTAPVTNSWVYYVVDLVDDERGGFLSFDGNLEYYFGYDGGESWSEGSREKTQVLSPIAKGVYVARVEAMHGDASGVLPLQVTIRQNVFQSAWLLMAFIVVMVPGLLMAWSKWRLENKRWANSSFADDDDEGDD